jgi:hypothetical protein
MRLKYEKEESKSHSSEQRGDATKTWSHLLRDLISMTVSLLRELHEKWKEIN